MWSGFPRRWHDCIRLVYSLSQAGVVFEHGIPAAFDLLHGLFGVVMPLQLKQDKVSPLAPHPDHSVDTLLNDDFARPAILEGGGVFSEDLG